MRKVYMKTAGGQTGKELPMSGVKVLVLNAFTEAWKEGEATMEFISKTATKRSDFKFVIRKDGSLSLFDYESGGAEQRDQIKRDPKVITTMIIWNVFKNPNWNNDRYWEMQPVWGPPAADTEAG